MRSRAGGGAAGGGAEARTLAGKSWRSSRAEVKVSCERDHLGWSPAEIDGACRGQHWPPGEAGGKAALGFTDLSEQDLSGPEGNRNPSVDVL